MAFHYPKKSISKWQKIIADRPMVSLGTWPTPVEPHTIPSSNQTIWVKRDDLSSTVYGGNKVRKLEFLLANAKGPILTVGALGSHHVLATARHAQTLGLPCIGVLVGQPVTPHVEQTLQLVQDACEQVIRVDQPLSSLTYLTGQLPKYAKGLFKGKRVNYIPPGGSTPLGTLGYVLCGLELAGQIKAGDCPKPDEIYLPLGTGGTATGLALGLQLANLDTQVIAVRVATKLVGNHRYINHLAKKTYNLICPDHPCKSTLPLNLKINHEFIGKGYGHPTWAGKNTMELFNRTKIPLETTYSAKALAALIKNQTHEATEITRMFLDTYGPIDKQ